MSEERSGFMIDSLLSDSRGGPPRDASKHSSGNTVHHHQTNGRDVYTSSATILQSSNEKSSWTDDVTNSGNDRLHNNVFTLADSRKRSSCDVAPQPRPPPTGEASSDHEQFDLHQREPRSSATCDVTIPDDVKKRPRTAFSGEQVRCLEQEFQKNKYLSMTKRMQMSRQLGLTEQQIKIWFQNRRTKWKRKFTNNLEMFGHHPYLAFGCIPSYPFHPPGFWQPSHLSIQPLAGVVRQPMMSQYIDTHFQQNTPPE